MVTRRIPRTRPDTVSASNIVVTETAPGHLMVSCKRGYIINRANTYGMCCSRMACPCDAENRADYEVKVQFMHDFMRRHNVIPRS